LAPVLEELKSTFLKAIEEKKISFSSDLAKVESVWADPSALVQVSSNLWDNAIKYSHPGGKVTLKLEFVPKGVRFTVEDNGPGISPEHVSRIFERFYRVDQS